MTYQQLLTAFGQFLNNRLAYYFGKLDKPPVSENFRLKKEKSHPFHKFVLQHRLSTQEQLILAAALVPHLSPEFYSNQILGFLPNGGDLPIFGCVKGKHHRGFLPTGETVLFILAGTDTEKRIEGTALLKQSALMKNGVISLEDVPAGEPVMSGKLTVAKEYLDLFLTGELSTPAFGPDFPAQKLDTDREWSDLVLPEHLKAQLNELKIWMLHNDRLMDDWDMRKKLKPGYRVLFHGPSGTGKTLTASLIGKYTGRDVFRVDLSTIVSKYIGETEKNLEKLFSKADNKDWILFFDEADALFGKRTQVSDSHDRYANQEVSYLLQRVENFNGLVILSTNLKSNIDEAFLRRFNAILKFTLPDSEERLRIWKSSLPEKMKPAKNLNLAEVAKRYKLTGGNIINAVHIASLDALNRKSDVITLDSVLHGIKREMEKEGKIYNNLFEEEIKSNGKQRG